jgi:hypothetical protein
MLLTDPNPVPTAHPIMQAFFKFVFGLTFKQVHRKLCRIEYILKIKR